MPAARPPPRPSFHRLTPPISRPPRRSQVPQRQPLPLALIHGPQNRRHLHCRPPPLAAMARPPRATSAQGKGRNRIPSPPFPFFPSSGPPLSPAEAPPRPPPPAAVAKLPRTTSARATAGNRPHEPHSLFSPTPWPPSRPEPPAQVPPASRRPSRVSRERGGRRQALVHRPPLPFSFFIKNPSTL